MIEHYSLGFVLTVLYGAPVLISVAFAAYAYHSRIAFFFGFAGCLFGMSVSHGGSTGGIIDQAEVRAESAFALGTAGALLGCAIGIGISLALSHRSSERAEAMH